MIRHDEHTIQIKLQNCETWTAGEPEGTSITRSKMILVGGREYRQLPAYTITRNVQPDLMGQDHGYILTGPGFPGGAVVTSITKARRMADLMGTEYHYMEMDNQK